MSVVPIWQVREPPLPAAGVVATGEQLTTALGRDTADRIAAGGQLRASAGDGWLIVLGDPDELPWVDGVRYLGWESGVLVPTTLACVPAASFVRNALAATVDELVALLPDAILVGPLPRRPADPRRLLPVPVTKRS